MTEEKLKDILTRIILIIIFVGFAMICCLISSSDKYEEDIDRLEKEVKEKDKFLQEKNHVIETILKKCGDRCDE